MKGEGSELRIVAHPVVGDVPAIAPRDGGLAPSLAEAFVPSPALDRLRQPGALAITSGQQPGLFGGPMYVVHKALAAAALARALEAAWQRPVVPIFWMAGDDHDWAEATRTAWWTAEGDVVSWALPPRADAAEQLPMSHELVPDQVAAARDRLAEDLPAGADRDRTIDWIDRHWRRDATLQQAFVGAISELLADRGVACLDATRPALKTAERSLIHAALEQHEALDAALVDAGDAGTGIRAGDGATLVFLVGSAGRDRLVADGKGFVTRRSGERFTREELFSLLEAEPERFSANVLLRPVVEAALLPTVGYVAGPGELRYLGSQASHLYPLLGVSPQAAVPRWGGTVADAVSIRLLGRLDLDADAVLADDGSLGRAVLRRDLAPEIPATVARLRAAIDDTAAELDRLGRQIDPVLERAIESRRRRLGFVADDLERLMERHLRKRDDIAFAQYRRLRRRLRPMDQPQERVIGVAGALGRWGDRWLDAVETSASAWADELVTAALAGVPR